MAWPAVEDVLVLQRTRGPSGPARSVTDSGGVFDALGDLERLLNEIIRTRGDAADLVAEARSALGEVRRLIDGERVVWHAELEAHLGEARSALDELRAENRRLLAETERIRSNVIDLDRDFDDRVDERVSAQVAALPAPPVDRQDLAALQTQVDDGLGALRDDVREERKYVDEKITDLRKKLDRRTRAGREMGLGASRNLRVYDEGSLVAEPHELDVESDSLTVENSGQGRVTFVFPKYAVVVEHGATAGTARPTADIVHWIGSVEPLNALDGDIWTDTA